LALPFPSTSDQLTRSMLACFLIADFFADHMHIRPIINAVRVYNVICNTVRLIVRKV